MAVNSRIQQRSNRMVINLLIILLLSWLVLFLWSVTLWMHGGFNSSAGRLYALLVQQSEATSQFNDLMVAEKINHTIAALKLHKYVENADAVQVHIKEQFEAMLTLDNKELDMAMRLAVDTGRKVMTLMNLSWQVLLIKFSILIAAAPLCLLAMTAGLIDGLNQRAIRTASLGRESSYVFHQLNKYVRRSIYFLLIVWMILPVPIAPYLVFIPLSLLLSLMVSITAKRFKKYL